jgi:hypothetical protein
MHFAQSQMTFVEESLNALASIDDDTLGVEIDQYRGYGIASISADDLQIALHQLREVEN